MRQHRKKSFSSIARWFQPPLPVEGFDVFPNDELHGSDFDFLLPDDPKLECYSYMEIRWQVMSSHTILNLWKKSLGIVPESVWDQNALEALVLADNRLIEVSERLGQLSNLRMLDLAHN